MAERVLIVGAGFSGSILAAGLARNGWECVLIDAGSHPRFAVGESSTPIADFLLARIARRWNLPELEPMTCWGHWQSALPDVAVGKKRGFSYFHHTRNRSWQLDRRAADSLLVAASSCDAWSDTHWYRPDVDQYLFSVAEAAGVTTRLECVLKEAVQRTDGGWNVTFDSRNGRPAEELAPTKFDFVIDSSGAANALGRWTGNARDDDWMRTQNASLFGHFTSVESFSKQVDYAQLASGAIFDPDDAAQHHLTKDGWLWQLRFNNGITSLGWVLTGDSRKVLDSDPTQSELRSWWDVQCQQYPSLSDSISEAKPATALMFSRRVSRCLSRASGPGWACSPGTYGLVDPLHSSGIAHSLYGVDELIGALVVSGNRREKRLARYSQMRRQEMKWIDQLTSECYRQLGSFQRFRAATALYFVAAVHMENQMADPRQDVRDGFLGSANELLQKSIGSVRRLPDALPDEQYIEGVRQAIAASNTVGLLDPISPHVVRHTTAPKHLTLS